MSLLEKIVFIADFISAERDYDGVEIMREKAVKSALKILTRDRIKKESKIDIEKLEHGYHITFTILDVETELLKITLYVADERQIEIVKENFFNNAVGIYSNILSSLTVE